MKSIQPNVINTLVGEALGYYAEEGITMELVPLGSNPSVMAGVEKGDCEIGIGVPSYQLPVVAKGDKLPNINFYEYTYPLKWDWVVKPDSPITELSQLKGKKVGVGSFTTSDFPMGKLWLSLAGLDPEKDVEWIAVGEGLPLGTALHKGDVAAAFHFDVNFGLIEDAGMKLRYLSRPKGLLHVGGLYLAASRDYMNKNPKIIVGMGRATAKATVFCLENPNACGYLYLKMYPEAAARGQPLPDQVKSVRAGFDKRANLWTPYDPAVKKWGYILESEWLDEVKFAGLDGQIKDVKLFFTNEFSDEINKFDQEAIKKQAKEFKLPY